MWRLDVLSLRQSAAVPSVPQEEEGGLRSEWPEGGGVWEKEVTDNGLQAMAEEDVDIHFYNEETFGVG